MRDQASKSAPRLPAGTHEARFDGISLWYGHDGDGDRYVSINTEDADEGVNDDFGYPRVFVYLNDATLNDPREQVYPTPSKLTVVYDISGLTQHQVDQLEMEAAVQAEDSEGHPSVTIIETRRS